MKIQVISSDSPCHSSQDLIPSSTQKGNTWNGFIIKASKDFPPQNNEKSSFLMSLPNEIKMIILDILSHSGVSQVESTCKSWNTLVKEWKLLKNFYRFDTPIFDLFHPHLKYFEKIPKSIILGIRELDLRKIWQGEILTFSLYTLFSQCYSNRVFFDSPVTKTKVIAVKYINMHSKQSGSFAFYHLFPNSVEAEGELGVCINRLPLKKKKDYLSRLLSGKPCGMLSRSSLSMEPIEGERTLQDGVTPMIQLCPLNTDPNSSKTPLS